MAGRPTLSKPDRTLIARLGFSDPDRKLPRHDLACQYLARPSIAQSLLLSLEKDDLKFLKIAGHQFECPLTKGQGSYKVVVGFVDLGLKGKFGEEYEIDGRRETWTVDRYLGIEVKITPTPTSEIIRQVRFYDEHGGCGSEKPKWVVVTDFCLSTAELDMLETAKIGYRRLGSGFDEWIKTQGRTPGRMVEV